MLPRVVSFGQTKVSPQSEQSGSADYAVRIRVSPIEIARNRIISTINYNGQFPGQLIRLKEGQPTTIDIFNDTDLPEQLHWHGQMVPADVDGSVEEGTPHIPAHGKRRISFTPRPSGFRFYHTHSRAGNESWGRPLAHFDTVGTFISTFGPESSTKCSGLEVVRYDADSLHKEFGVSFRLQGSSKELYETPFGTVQQFLCCYCRLE